MYGKYLPVGKELPSEKLLQLRNAVNLGNKKFVYNALGF